MIREQSGICITFQMVVVESIEIQVCQDIGIMYKKRLVALQQRTGFFDTTTGIQQFTPFVTDMNIHTEVLVCTKEVYNLTSKMVDVYGDIMEAGIFSFKMTRSSIVLPATETSALGILSVSGRRRVPRPAANIIAFIVLNS